MICKICRAQMYQTYGTMTTGVFPSYFFKHECPNGHIAETQLDTAPPGQESKTTEKWFNTDGDFLFEWNPQGDNEWEGHKPG